MTLRQMLARASLDDRDIRILRGISEAVEVVRPDQGGVGDVVELLE